MPHPRRLAAASAIAIAAAGPAAAELTAAQVWADFENYLPGTAELTVESETPTPSGLRVEGISWRVQMPAQPGVTTSEQVTTIPYVEFIENDDGTVTVEMAETTEAVTEVEGPAGAFTSSLVIELPGNETVAREIEGGIEYDFTAPTMVMRTGEMVEGATAVPVSFELALSDLAGTYSMIGDAERTYEQTLAASSAALDISGTDPQTGGAFSVAARFDGIASTGAGSWPEGVDMTSLGAAIQKGLTAEGSVSFTSSDYRIDITEEAGPTSISGGAKGGGSLDFRMGEGGIGYSAASEDSALTISGAEIPLPQINAAIARSGFDVLMPAVASEAAGPFRLAMRLEELAIDDQLWSMLDPAGQLDRSAWTLALDLTGMARLDVDIFDPEAMAEADPNAAPGQVESASIDELRLSVLGADLTGSGAFAFDSSDMTTFGGMPAPEGTLRLSLTGANAFMEQLVALGFVPEDQVMMGRMMLGLFARSVGEDAFETEIEIRPDGTVLANGQQLQ